MTHSTQKRKNVITLIVIGCLVAIAAIVTTTVLLTQNTHTPVVTPPIDNPDPGPVEPTVQTMKAPLATTDVSLGYAIDKLIYSETMKLWQTHAAMDFKAEKGTNVTAVLDGTVTKVASDPLNGTYVVISHENGKTTAYKSLGEASVKEGDKVKQGDVIGKVGDTMISEAAQGAHLHFELTIDGKPANPADYIDTLGGK